MTSAEFVAACFWPVAILLSGLLWFVRDTVLRRWFAIITAVFLLAYLFLWLAYGQSSLIEVIDEEIFLAVLGAWTLGIGLYRLLATPAAISENAITDGPKWKAFFMVLGGVILIAVSSFILFQDFARPRLLLEGRVQKVQVEHRRRTYYAAYIADRRVNVTVPLYRRLSLLPVVRAEVGRGSNHIFKIDYLSN